MFNKKVKKQPQSIYVSKNRIVLPRYNTEGDDRQQGSNKKL